MTPTTTAPPRSRSAAQGFSLIEALFASVLILVMMLFVLPLFTRAAISTVSGKESTIATTHGKWSIEEVYQLPLDRDVLTVGGNVLSNGDPGREACATWDRDEREWVDYTCASGVPADRPWARTTTLRQYAMNDLYYDGDRTLQTPLPGSTPLEFVHLRELGVSIEGQRGLQPGFSPLGPARQVDFVTLRGF